MTDPRENVTDEEIEEILKRIKKLEKRIQKAMLAVDNREEDEDFNFSKQWNIIDSSRKEIRKISGDENYPTG